MSYIPLLKCSWEVYLTGIGARTGLGSHGMCFTIIEGQEATLGWTQLCPGLFWKRDERNAWCIVWMFYSGPVHGFEFSKYFQVLYNVHSLQSLFIDNVLTRKVWVAFCFGVVVCFGVHSVKWYVICLRWLLRMDCNSQCLLSCLLVGWSLWVRCCCTQELTTTTNEPLFFLTLFPTQKCQKWMLRSVEFHVSYILSKRNDQKKCQKHGKKCKKHCWKYIRNYKIKYVKSLLSHIKKCVKKVLKMDDFVYDILPDFSHN